MLNSSAPLLCLQTNQTNKHLASALWGFQHLKVLLDSGALGWTELILNMQMTQVWRYHQQTWRRLQEKVRGAGRHLGYWKVDLDSL